MNIKVKFIIGDDQIESVLNDESTCGKTVAFLKSKIPPPGNSESAIIDVGKGRSFLPASYLNGSYKQRGLILNEYSAEVFLDAAAEATRCNPLSGVILEMLKLGYFLDNKREVPNESDDNWALYPITDLEITTDFEIINIYLT